MQLEPQISAEASDYGTQAQRLTFLKHLRDDRRFTQTDLAQHSLYSTNSIKGWFSENAQRRRDIPDRAVRLLLQATGITEIEYRSIVAS